MANVFFNIAVPGSGTGAPTDVSTAGQEKTITVQGAFVGTIEVQYSLDGTIYAPLKTFTQPGKITAEFVAQFIRVVVTGAAAANVDVASEEIGQDFSALAAPAGNGVGAATDISIFGTFNTVTVGGTFTGVVIIEISLDNVDWAQCFVFQQGGPVAQSKSFIAQFMRVRRSGVGVVPGTATVAVGAVRQTLFDPGRTVIVAKTGGDFSTIAAGLTAAAALTPPPSATNPAMVWVFPGIYSEVPLTLVPFVALTAVDGNSVTIIEATVTTSPIVTGVANSEIEGLTLQGADGVGGIGLNHATSILTGRKLVVRDCTIGYQATGVDTNLTLFDCLASRGVGETMDTAYIAESGGVLRGNILQAIGVPSASLIGVGFCAIDAGSLSSLQGITAIGCIDGVRSDTTAVISVVSGIVLDCTNGLRIGPTSGTVRADNVRVTDSTAFDLLIESATAVVTGIGNTFRSDLISVTAGATVLLQFASEFLGDRAIICLGEFHVGSETAPSESAFGGGDSHVRNMSVLRNTNLEAGTFSDITAAMSSATGSTADAFPGIGAGNTLFVGGAVAFPANKINTAIAIVLGAGSLIWEFSNGGGWTAMNVMAADSVAPFDQHAQTVFGRIATEQIRFGPMVGWTTQAVNGINKFWIRARVAVAITTVPTLEQVKLGTDRTEINADGVLEHFGAAEVIRDLTWHQRLMDDLAGASPVNGALVLSTNITITPVDNRFNNSALDGLGGLFEIPAELDTSRPVVIQFDWIPKATGGDVEFQSDFAEISLGDVLDGSIADTNVGVIIAAPAIDVLTRTTLSIDVEELEPGALLAFSLFRDATGGNPNDTLAGAIDIVTVSLLGTFWR